jgi:hypothetical protein
MSFGFSGTMKYAIRYANTPGKKPVTNTKNTKARRKSVEST